MVTAQQVQHWYADVATCINTTGKRLQHQFHQRGCGGLSVGAGNGNGRPLIIFKKELEIATDGNLFLPEFHKHRVVPTDTGADDHPIIVAQFLCLEAADMQRYFQIIRKFNPVCIKAFALLPTVQQEPGKRDTCLPHAEDGVIGDRFVHITIT